MKTLHYWDHCKKGFGCVKRERIILKNELNDLFVLVLLDHLDALAVVELNHFLLLSALAALLQSAHLAAKTHHWKTFYMLFICVFVYLFVAAHTFAFRINNLLDQLKILNICISHIKTTKKSSKKISAHKTRTIKSKIA